MKYSGVEIIIKLLENEGVEFIFGIFGGFNLLMYDVLYNSIIKYILVCYE